MLCCCFAGPKVIIETVSLTVGMLLINTLIPSGMLQFSLSPPLPTLIFNCHLPKKNQKKTETHYSHSPSWPLDTVMCTVTLL